MALDAHKQKLRDIIAALKKDDDRNEARGEAAVRFARACRGCDTADPADRVFSTECGHAVCHECADGRSACAACDVPTEFVRLYEDVSSRECGVCLAAEPMSRDVFTECGHILCTACVVQMRLDIVCDWLKRFRCPFCDKQKKYKKRGSWNARKLIEEPTEATVISESDTDSDDVTDSDVDERTSKSCFRDFFRCLTQICRKS